MEEKIFHLLNNGKRLVLATIIGHEGSTPRTSGTKMIVFEDGSIIGTIGGGIVEADVIKAAREIFNQTSSKTTPSQTTPAQLKNYNLKAGNIAETMDLICGGTLAILIELIQPIPDNIEIFQEMTEFLQNGKRFLNVISIKRDQNSDYRVQRAILIDKGVICGKIPLKKNEINKLAEKYHGKHSPSLTSIHDRRFFIEPGLPRGTVFLFGAGHVSQHTESLARLVDFKTIVIDDRVEFANKDRFPEADEILALKSYKNVFTKLSINPDSYIVIVTRGHAHDRDVLARALKTKAGYIGMIGSRKKRDAIYKKLLKEGFSFDDLKRVNSPIGLNIGAETPQEIGFSIVSELIKKRHENI